MLASPITHRRVQQPIPTQHVTLSRNPVHPEKTSAALQRADAPEYQPWVGMISGASVPVTLRTLYVFSSLAQNMDRDTHRYIVILLNQSYLLGQLSGFIIGAYRADAARTKHRAESIDHDATKPSARDWRTSLPSVALSAAVMSGCATAVGLTAAWACYPNRYARYVNSAFQNDGQGYLNNEYPLNPTAAAIAGVMVVGVVKIALWSYFDAPSLARMTRRHAPSSIERFRAVP